MFFTFRKKIEVTWKRSEAFYFHLFANFSLLLYFSVQCFLLFDLVRNYLGLRFFASAVCYQSVHALRDVIGKFSHCYYYGCFCKRRNESTERLHSQNPLLLISLFDFKVGNHNLFLQFFSHYVECLRWAAKSRSVSASNFVWRLINLTLKLEILLAAFGDEALNRTTIF